MKKDFLLEIGTEEIPARLMKATLQQLKELVEEKFKANLIEAEFSAISTYGTPRRLIIFVPLVSLKQTTKFFEFQGPSVKIAFDNEGKPTPAAYGFAKAQGIKVEELVIKEKGKGKSIFAVKKEEGKTTLEIFSLILPQIIISLSFPKPMRWNDEIKFIRPIRWLLALLGNKIIPFELSKIKSGKITYGHRFLAPEKIEINNPKEYFQKIEEKFVIYDQEKRKKMIKLMMEQVVLEKAAKVVEDEELLEIVTFLVEYPQVICGTFNRSYLDLPAEVLSETMKQHQQFFSVIDKNNHFLPYFISVINTKPKDEIKQANEKVLASRLSDAKFYFEEDKKVPLHQKVKDLEKILFLENLGNLYEKTERIKKLSQYLARKFQPAMEGVCERIAYLCKADLTTAMIKEKEYTNLHGIMGKKYAELSFETKEVANGIFEYCLPRYNGDFLPQTMAGALVSIADKIDTIIGCFSLGLIPTGSEDPHGNRRFAAGIIEIIYQKELNISLEKLINEAIKGYGEKIKVSPEKLLVEIIEFILQRLRSFLKELGIKYDMLNAVFAVERNNPLIIINKAKILSSFLKENNSLVVSFSRVKNILSSKKINLEKKRVLTYEKLLEKEEKELYLKYIEIKDETIAFIETFKYREALELLSQLKKPIDEFFNQVLVMTEDEILRDNRLALLEMIAQLFFKMADFSKIVIN